ncbi:MAG: Ig domain-containing protein, partial [Geminicoccaceae bacterium]
AVLAALVVVPSAAAIRFTDDSYFVPAGVVGSPYSHQFKGDGGCGPALPYQFRILNGGLPPGLALASSGFISGTPTQAGSWSFWVELSDQDPPSASWCRSAKSEREFTIEVAPAGTGQQPPSSGPPQQPPPASGTAPQDESQPGPGIQVGPPLTADQGTDTPGGQVEVNRDKKPRWWDLPGRVRYGITSWFRGLVEDALNPMLELIGKTVLATPQIAGQDRVGDLWLISLGIADGLLILFVLAGAALLMTHETLHTRYALKEMLPRIALAAILVNASLSLSGQMIAAANALSGGFLAGGVNPGEASLQLKHFILGAVARSGIFVILLGLVAAALAVFLFILYVVRAALILILVAGAPLMLLTHALPQTDGLARLWWRGMTAALGVQVAQALVLATSVRVFFSSGGREALGLSVTGNLIDLLVCLCLFWILIKIPFWAKDLAFSPGRSGVVQIARGYVMARGLRALP